jgi:hypothetical protein
MVDEKAVIDDHNWGCLHSQVNSGHEKIKICHVDVTDIKKVANELASSVLNTSWITEMDKGASRAYERTVNDTANSLVDVFNETVDEDKVNKEFGELMVSMGSSRSLELIFDHCSLPISELWKPQVKQNEGFDFHSVCPGEIVNFGEAKYASPKYPSPYSNAANQANGFIEAEKHYRDRPHLINLVSQDSISNLDNEIFGVVISFSMNSKKPLQIYDKAVLKAKSLAVFNDVAFVYVVGVSHGID